MMDIYKSAETELDFFRRAINELNLQLDECDEDLYFLFLRDMASEGRHLFNLELRSLIDERDRYVILRNTGDMSMLQWTGDSVLSWILITEDIPTIKFLLSSGTITEKLAKNHLWYVIRSANLEIIKAFEYCFGEDLFDQPQWAMAFVDLASWIKYAYRRPKMVPFFVDKMNVYIMILNARLECSIPLFETNDPFHPAFQVTVESICAAYRPGFRDMLKGLAAIDPTNVKEMFDSIRNRFVP